ncbi:MSC_0624 family F1-like ATPase-associated membrane protein [Ureaplasma zalophigenitalium]|uniref:DUF1600 domain-containing protein n=1 Tax=Ureaplasma zalophigenitalium TaxID=907723 RepID=A0ABT3BPD6_9BACT|nr:hypothetical protein [Ureaplasma zalophigenitalium]MCV3754104.1 hypothetical protein [Ureaplasma zalophigenitalium]
MRNILLSHNLAIKDRHKNKQFKTRLPIHKIINYILIIIYFAICVAVFFTIDKYFFHAPKQADIKNLLIYNDSFIYFKNVALITQSCFLLLSQFFSIFFIYKLIDNKRHDFKKIAWALALYASVFIISLGLYFGFTIHNWKDVFYTSFLFVILGLIHLLVFIFINSKAYSIDLTFIYKKKIYYLAYAAAFVFIFLGIGLLGGLGFNDESFNLLKANSVDKQYVPNKVYEFFVNLNSIINHPGYAVVLFLIICLLIANLACVALVFILNFKKYKNDFYQTSSLLSFSSAILLSSFLYFSTISFNNTNQNIYLTFKIKESFNLLYLNLVFSILFIFSFSFILFYSKTKNKVKNYIFNMFMAFFISHWMLTYLLISNQTNNQQNFLIVWLSCITSIVNFIVMLSRINSVKRYQSYVLNISFLFVIVILILNAVCTWLKRYNNIAINDYYLSLWNMTFIPFLIFCSGYAIVKGSIYISLVIKNKKVVIIGK